MKYGGLYDNLSAYSTCREIHAIVLYGKNQKTSLRTNRTVRRSIDPAAVTSKRPPPGEPVSWCHPYPDM